MDFDQLALYAWHGKFYRAVEVKGLYSHVHRYVTVRNGDALSNYWSAEHKKCIHVADVARVILEHIRSLR